MAASQDLQDGLLLCLVELQLLFGGPVDEQVRHLVGFGSRRYPIGQRGRGLAGHPVASTVLVACTALVGRPNSAASSS